MSDYKPVKDAMQAGTPPELICATCPWDRLCITPPSMNGGDVDQMLKEAEAKDAAADGQGDKKMPVNVLITALAVGGRDTMGQLCPVFALRLRSPEGRVIADGIRQSMRGES